MTCQFGVMFFPDRRAAFREVRRVLTPGGRFNPPTFLQRVPYSYNDISVISADLDAPGLQVGEVVSLALTERADSPAQVATGFCQGTPLALEIEKRAPLAETTLRVADLLAAQLGSGPLTGALTAHVITAHR